MNEEFVITIGGPHGSGRSTIAKAVAERYGLRHFATGDVFRRIAQERGWSVLELDQKAEEEVDWEVDRQSKQAALAGRIVFESDLAAWVNAATPGKTVIKIWLDATPETCGERIFNDEKSRTSEKYPTVEEAIKAAKMRFEADKKRYMRHYNVNIVKLAYDKIIDTNLLDTTGVKREVFKFLENKGLKPGLAKE